MNWRWKYASVLTACLLTVCAPVFGGGGGGGEVNTASNLGAGEGVFAQKNVADLEFKSLVAGTNIDITSDSNTITIDNTLTTVGSGTGGYELVFGSSAGVLNDVCLRAEATSNTGGVACTTNHIIVLHPIAVHTGETPKMTRFSCFITQAATGLDDGESWVLTPTWVQGDGAGALNTDAGTNTLTCTGSASSSDPCELLGTGLSTDTEDTSPYSGPQAIRVNVNKGGSSFNTPAITCQIRLEIT